MTRERNLVHPNFILGLFSQLLFFGAGMLIGSNIEWGKILAIVAVMLAAVHWIWGMVDAWRDPGLKNKEVGNHFWFSLILLIPPLAGLMYYMILDKRIRFG